MLRRHEVVAVEPDQPFLVTGAGFKKREGKTWEPPIKSAISKREAAFAR
jgi:hypothetical protein